ncbi:GNAT family N-acetyltransferase [uncultured Bradyrhizobium sp.]|uniref:GNAT family N-acetyltransferase n=1 Tax=uncultured Bradyrhizobium sp. TaxID=199684 RepID=UPI0035CA2095
MIRRVQPADIEQLVELCRLHAAYEAAEYAENHQAERLKTALFGNEPELFGWVAEGSSGLLDGYMTAVVEFATWPAKRFIYMDCLYLRPDARGRGLGRAFIDALISFASKRCISRLEWQTPPSNELGIGFYRRLGAVDTSKRRFRLDSVDAREPN